VKGDAFLFNENKWRFYIPLADFIEDVTDKFRAPTAYAWLVAAAA